MPVLMKPRRDKKGKGESKQESKTTGGTYSDSKPKRVELQVWWQQLLVAAVGFVSICYAIIYTLQLSLSYETWRTTAKIPAR